MSGVPTQWLYLHKSNAVNERLADGLSYGRRWSLESYVRPWPSHSNSFGNDADKGAVGCRASDRKFIVKGAVVEAFLEPSCGRRIEPIHSIPFSVAHDLGEGH